MEGVERGGGGAGGDEEERRRRRRGQQPGPPGVHRTSSSFFLGSRFFFFPGRKSLLLLGRDMSDEPRMCALSVVRSGNQRLRLLPGHVFAEIQLGHVVCSLEGLNSAPFRDRNTLTRSP